MLCKLKQVHGDEVTIERLLKAMREADVVMPDDPTGVICLRIFSEGLFDKAGSIFGLKSVNKAEEQIMLVRKPDLRHLNRKK